MRFWRFYLVLVFFSLLGAAILSRLVFLQIKKHDYYQAMSEGQQKILKEESGKRGEIFFRSGEPAVINKTGSYVFLCPNEIKEKEKVADVLSSILNLDKKWLLEKAKKDNLFEVVKRRLSLEEENKIKEANMEGVHCEKETFRYYPHQELAAHALGFLSADGQGQYGVEGFYNEILKGKEILAERERGPFGFFKSSAEKTTGKNLVLTLDSSLQLKAEKLLSDNEKNLKFESGQILVMDPNSGEIMAMAEWPSFNPNLYNEIESPEIFKNALLQKIFEPGSVFKPITMSAAINEGKISPETTYIDAGLVKIGGSTIYNYGQKVFGEQTMTGVLEKSINTGAVFAEKKLGHELFLEYLDKFGFFEKTGVDLQGEVFSENLEFKKGYEVNFATASFGQGIEITPIQIAVAFSALANGGKLVKPHILKQAEGISLDLREKEIISKETSYQIVTMLSSVIENGFGKAAKVNGYYLAGKTGTAQVSWPALNIQKRGYSEKTVQTFVGFGPAFNPKFLILIKLDNPQTKTAEYSAAPIFKELAKYIIDYWQIVPDYE